MPKQREVAGCIPVRFVEDPSGQRNIEVLMVLSKAVNTRWLFPKGGVDRGEKPVYSAQRESFEEAGVLGSVIGRLGAWSFKNQNQQMYLLNVTVETPHYDEAVNRQKKWCSFDEAKTTILDSIKNGDKRGKSLLDMIVKAEQQLGTAMEVI